MAQSESDTEQTIRTMSVKQAFILAGTVVTMVGAVGVAYITHSPVDQPSAELVALQREYARVSTRLNEIDKTIDGEIEYNRTQHIGIDLRLQGIEADDNACAQRAERIERKIDDHLALATKKIIEYDVALERLSILTGECRRVLFGQ